MNPLDYFPPTYDVARRRFRDAAGAAGAVVDRYLITTGESDLDLSIDVATVLGCPKPKWSVIITSGLHGVEGFFGSAVQLAWLSNLAGGGQLPADGAVVLVHAVNPFGFAQLRRTNEDNVDLNRNFLNASDAYAAAQSGYDALDPFLNPTSPPSRIEPFRLKAFWYVRQHGLPALKNTVACGQHRFPRGLFFGGHGPAPATRIVQQHLASWLGGALRAVHVDLHSGLGVHGRYRLLLVESDGSPELEWYRDTFGSEVVEPLAIADGTAYDASGTLGGWTMHHLTETRYRFVSAEFGTYPILRVLGALREENRAHFFGRPGTGAHQRAKAELLECFYPHSDRWRELVVEQGLAIIDRAVCAQSTG